MAATLSIGPVFQMAQNVVFALPPKRVLLFTDGAAPTLFQSNTEAFTLSVAVTLAGGQAELAGAFVRVTSATTINVRLVGV